MLDLHALLRRLRAGETNKGIARALGLDRKTVRKYRHWAETQHLLTGPLPDLAALHACATATLNDDNPPQNRTSLEKYRDQIAAWLTQGLGPTLIYRKLTEDPAFIGSEAAVWRLTVKLRATSKTPKVVGRLETPPGEVAQVDFGYVGQLLDPTTNTLRKAWVFVMVLAWSRHMYAEFVFDQKIITWLLGHQHAFGFFGGVPQRVVLDNLKAAITQAYTAEKDPEVQRAYAECAEHYGFLIDPCLPSTPQHKGKVERGGVAYLQQSFMPLLPPNTTLPEANRRLHQHWLKSVAGLRDHGTTHEAPLARFAKTERAALLSLPVTAYDPAVWKQVKLHRDGHVVFEKSYYSAPCRLVGQSLWLRAGLQEIRLFSGDFVLVTTHPRAAQPGQRLTQPDHLPAEKAQGLTTSRAACQAQAEAIGPMTAQVIAELLADRPVDRFRTALRVLRLAEHYSPARLEAACVRGLAFSDTRLPTLKRFLAEGLDQCVLTLPAPGSETPLCFARPVEELAAAILERGKEGGVRWN